MNELNEQQLIHEAATASEFFGDDECEKFAAELKVSRPTRTPEEQAAWWKHRYYTMEKGFQNTMDRQREEIQKKSAQLKVLYKDYQSLSRAHEHLLNLVEIMVDNQPTPVSQIKFKDREGPPME